MHFNQIAVKQSHEPVWACSSNKFSEDVELFDSNQPFLTVNVVGVQPQYGGADCGLFAISMAFDLCSGIDPFTQEVVQEQMREHLVSCFEKCKMSAFPKVPRQAMERRKQVVHSVSVDIYCVCRHVEVGKMVMCDVCHEWYHRHCISIPPEVFQRNSPPWECPRCKCEKAILHPHIDVQFVGEERWDGRGTDFGLLFDSTLHTG